MLVRNLLDIEARNNLQMTKKLHIITNTTLRQKIALWLMDNSLDQKQVIMDMNREELEPYRIKYSNGVVKYLDGIVLRERNEDESTEV